MDRRVGGDNLPSPLRRNLQRYQPAVYQLHLVLDLRFSKLQQQLESDPQLQSIEDTTILNDEQYSVAFESSIVNLKEMIPLTSSVTILRWQDGKDGKQLTQDQLQRMRVQRQKTIRNLCLNPTMDNPWDQIKLSSNSGRTE